MRALITSSRFPHALDLVRKLGERGHEVLAADTFEGAPGSRSRYVAERIVTTAPAFEPDEYVNEIEELVRGRGVDMLLPAFEEAFYLAPHRERLARHTDAFFPSFEVIQRLHDKRAFPELARELGLAAPRTIAVESERELRRAIASFPEHIARPAFSRGGVTLLTNVGPLAGRVRVEDCRPSPECPWIVQEYVRGTDVCSFGVAHHGRYVAHSAYEHPKTIEHAGGILFVSVDEPESLRMAQRIVEALGYHGHVSFDFMRTERGLVLLECNPRPTAGVFMMSSEDYERALIAPRTIDAPLVVPAGVRRQIAVALLRDMVRNPKEIPADLRALFSGVPDVYTRRDDAMPAIWSVLSYSRVRAFRRWAGHAGRRPSDLVAAQFFDIAWDGAPMRRSSRAA